MKISCLLLVSIGISMASFSCSVEEGETASPAAGDSLKVREKSPPISKISRFKIKPSDSKGILVEEVVFDEKGKLITDIDYLFTGSNEIWETTTYKYDDAGRQVEMRMSDKDGAEWLTTYEYAQNGKVKVEKVKEPGSSFVFNYTHDDKGSMIQSVKKDAKGKVLETSLSKPEYDENGKLLSQEDVVLDGKGKETEKMKLKFTYDENGNTILLEEFDESGKLAETVNMRYNDNNQETESISLVNGKFNIKMTSEYNQYGDLIREIGFEKSPDKATYIETFEFDKYGNEIKSWYESSSGEKYGERSEITYRDLR